MYKKSLMVLKLQDFYSKIFKVDRSSGAYLGTAFLFAAAMTAGDKGGGYEGPDRKFGHPDW
jgi:hypothetical protein